MVAEELSRHIESEQFEVFRLTHKFGHVTSHFSSIVCSVEHGMVAKKQPKNVQFWP
jgi:hypothetical protein